MLAVRFDGSLTVTQVPAPVAAPGEALVRTRLAGICNTDLEITKGYMGFRGTLGHEFVGEVISSPVASWTGQRVVGDINLPCGRCSVCGDGRGRHCPHRTVLGILNKDGAFAEYLTLPVANLHRVPDSIDDRCAALVEPLAAALRILEQVEIRPGRRVLLVGDGKLGLLIGHVLSTTGCDLRVVGRHPHKLAMMARLAAMTTLLGDYIPERHDVVVEASGSASGLAVAVRSVRANGVLVLKSTYAEVGAWDLAPLVIDEVTLVGSRCGRADAALQFLIEHHPAVHDLIEATYPLSRAAEAFAHASRPSALKVLLSATD